MSAFDPHISDWFFAEQLPGEKIERKHPTLPGGTFIDTLEGKYVQTHSCVDTPWANKEEVEAWAEEAGITVHYRCEYLPSNPPGNPTGQVFTRMQWRVPIESERAIFVLRWGGRTS